MPPYFETVKSFADVPFTENGIETQSFLEASDGLVQMFDLFGSGVFGFIQSDLRSNIAGVRARYDSATTHEKSATLEALVESEHMESHKHATPCLVRLVRGLALTCKALQNMQSDKSSELHVCFKRSYDEVLRHHHSFIIRSIVSVAIRAVPRRNDFYMRIAQGGSIEKLDTELGKWLYSLEKIVKHVSDFLERGGYGKV
ncbi:glycolipid transfer protein [Phlegmacium glaucopus]|nr:glycolipid transfer protein [Phlegmacium glaucopus]